MSNFADKYDKLAVGISLAWICGIITTFILLGLKINGTI